MKLVKVLVLAVVLWPMIGCDLDSENNDNTIVEVHDGGSVTIVDGESNLSQDQIEGKTRVRMGDRVIYE